MQLPSAVPVANLRSLPIEVDAMNPLRWSYRTAYLVGLLICALLVGYAWFAELFLHITPCLLCWLQRFSFWFAAAGFLLGGLHAPASRWRWVYTAIAVVGCAVGVAVACRQLWLQNLPAGTLHSCLPPLSYLMDNFTMIETLKMVLEGSQDCAQVHWRFLGLTMAGWTLIWYVLLGLWALWHARGPRRRPSFA